MEQPWFACFCCCRRNCDATRGGTRPCDLLTNDTALFTLRWRHFTAVHKGEINAFRDHLNEQNADIQFTKEIEENGKCPFLSCDNNELRTTVYIKPTHTDRLLDESSYNPTSHKATTIKTLTRRAQLVCGTPDSLRDENRYLESVFHKNNYNVDFIRRNIYRPTEADATNRNPTSVTTVTIPYIKGTSETISRILQPYNTRVPTHLQLRYDNYWPTLKTDTNPSTDRERLQDQMLRLPGFLHWWDWQKP